MVEAEVIRVILVGLGTIHTALLVYVVTRIGRLTMCVEFLTQRLAEAGKRSDGHSDAVKHLDEKIGGVIVDLARLKDKCERDAPVKKGG